MLSIIDFLLILTVKTIFCLFLLFVVFVIAIKLWADPVKSICKCTTELHGKIALVTGGNAGIGFETARDLAKRGARVIIASRNTKKSAKAVSDIIESTGNTRVEYRQLNLAKFDAVREFAEDFNREFPRLDILVNNAGCAAIKSRITEDGIQNIAQINYFGAFLLTNLLLDKLIASKPSRIVIVSSIAHRTWSFDPEDIKGLDAHKTESYWKIYCRSKLCQILWTKALAKRLPLGVTVNSLHPGIVNTEIFDKAPPFLRVLIKFVIDLLFKTPLEGAQTTIHLCVAPELESASGGYYENCKPSRVARVINDDSLVERIWNESLTLTKV